MTAITAPQRAVREILRTVAEWAAPFWKPDQRRLMMSVQETSEIRELTSDEVDQVDGGLVVIAIIAILIGMLVPAVQ